MIIDKPGIYDISNDDYHADPCPVPSLSSSGARKILKTCPAKYWFERNNPPAKSNAFNVGNAAHDWLLTGDDWLDRNAVLPKDHNQRTNAGKAHKAELEAKGLTVITHGEFEAVKAMVDAIKDHEFAWACFQNGKAEQSLFWQDEEFGIWCRVRLDWWPDNNVFFVDYKTTVNAESDYLSKAMFDYGYHQQAAWYTEGIKKVIGVRDPKFIFVFQEKSEPHLVQIAQTDQFALQWGHIQNQKAKQIFANCLEAGEWPAYSDDVISLDIPHWAHTRLEIAKDLGLFDIGAKNPNGLREV